MLCQNAAGPAGPGAKGTETDAYRGTGKNSAAKLPTKPSVVIAKLRSGRGDPEQYLFPRRSGLPRRPPASSQRRISGLSTACCASPRPSASFAVGSFTAENAARHLIPECSPLESGAKELRLRAETGRPNDADPYVCFYSETGLRTGAVIGSEISRERSSVRVERVARLLAQRCDGRRTVRGF